MRIQLPLPALLLLVAMRAAPAQSLSRGTPIRVELSLPSRQLLEGTFDGITDDSIFVSRTQRGDVRLSRAEVNELYQGIESDRRASSALGALEGAPVGMLAGALLGEAVAKRGAGHRVVGGVLGALTGLIVGATVGGTLGHDKPSTSWVRIPWPSEADAGD